MQYERKTRDIYELVWSSQYGVEVVDTAETRQDARYLRGEYQMAYGEGSVSIRKRRERLALRAVLDQAIANA